MRFSLSGFQGLASILFSVNQAESFENDLRLTLDSVSAISDLLTRTKVAGVNLYAYVILFQKFSK